MKLFLKLKQYLPGITVLLIGAALGQTELVSTGFSILTATVGG